MEMEALHPDTFKPQLPAGYESAAAVYHRWVLGRLNLMDGKSNKQLLLFELSVSCRQESEVKAQYG